MQRELVIVGVFGGDEQRGVAERVGREITISGHILLTGGRRKPNSERTTEAAQNGAESEMKRGHIVRAIGILPNGAGALFSIISHRERIVYIDTGVSHKSRDATNGATADVVIALKGSTGTLTEIAFAHFLGTPVVLLGSKTHLQCKFAEHRSRPLGDGASCDFLIQGLKTYPQWNANVATITTMEMSLADCLSDAVEFSLSSWFNKAICAKAVKLAIKLAQQRGLGAESGFPGIPPDLVASKAEFEFALRQF